MQSWELTEDEYLNLNDTDKLIYKEAEICMNSEIAGGLYGWSRGMELLKSIGWIEQKREEGHRTFISLLKPIMFKFKSYNGL